MPVVDYDGLDSDPCVWGIVGDVDLFPHHLGSLPAARNGNSGVGASICALPSHPKACGNKSGRRAGRSSPMEVHRMWLRPASVRSAMPRVWRTGSGRSAQMTRYEKGAITDCSCDNRRPVHARSNKQPRVQFEIVIRLRPVFSYRLHSRSLRRTVANILPPSNNAI
jgi:hypothetical protein